MHMTPDLLQQGSACERRSYDQSRLHEAERHPDSPLGDRTRSCACLRGGVRKFRTIGAYDRRLGRAPNSVSVHDVAGLLLADETASQAKLAWRWFRMKGQNGSGADEYRISRRTPTQLQLERKGGATPEMNIKQHGLAGRTIGHHPI
ncbi:hypothetical protein Bbelb_291850 [Branchiostoma belcheri]|nr:hypothetical protein Bbelb_291850 [Branchiostoma belcheri]